ncbi:MAG: hypothetical protein U5K76_10710 [Woeseiaceae bacterium]|nr:hypothetical protein [Woeseiaceae bacterium]
MKTAVTLVVLASCAVPAARAQHSGHEGMHVTTTGIVMNENRDRLPRGCDAISGDVEFTIHAGRAFAGERPGVIFGMSDHEVRVEPCSRVTVHFVNEDDVRHQWMVHGLPRYLYPAGMFHIEAMGGQRQSGTFIAPAGDRTYLIHCDMAQHMEKGMRGQLVVGEGSGDLWAVTGISDPFRRSAYFPSHGALALVLAAGAAFAVMLAMRRRARGPD